jgi:hypothetical protein
VPNGFTERKIYSSRKELEYFRHEVVSTSSNVGAKVMLSLCFHEGVWGSGCIDPCFLDLGTSWR